MGNTVRPKSLDPIHIVTSDIKWVKTYWINSRISKTVRISGLSIVTSMVLPGNLIPDTTMKNIRNGSPKDVGGGE